LAGVVYGVGGDADRRRKNGVNERRWAVVGVVIDLEDIGLEYIVVAAAKTMSAFSSA